jgi:hypothetical protein
MAIEKGVALPVPDWAWKMICSEDSKISCCVNN